MRVFLTGGTGFIGSHFLKLLLDKGHEVTAHRRSETSAPRIELKNKVQWLTKSFSELNPKDFHDIDIVCHLAAHSVQYPFDTLENNIFYNVVEPLKIFEKANLAGVSKFLVTGTCYEYGESANHYEFIPATASLLPTNSYGTSKAMSFLALRNFCVENKCTLFYPRLFHVYGEGQPKDRLWPSLMKAASENSDFELTSGNQVRDFISISEVVHCLLYIITKNSEKGDYIKITNVGSGKPLSVKEFAQKIWKEENAKGNLIFNGMAERPNELKRIVSKTNQS